MNNHSESLVVQIDLGDGTFRDALPVRSIPHVTGWVGDFGVPPLEVAIRLQTNINLHAWEVVAYRLLDGKPVAIQPRQWEMVETQLAGFSKKLHRLYPRDEHLRPSDEGLAEWQSQATEKLPARAFVWLDEFKAEYRGWFGLKFKSRPNLVIPEFDLTPLLSEQVRKMVLEGFEQRKQEELTVVGKLFDEIEKLKTDIDDWKSTDHSKTADRLVLKQQIAPLESRLTELDEEKRVLRGDYLEHKQAKNTPLMTIECVSGDSKSTKSELGWRLKPSLERAPGYRWPLYKVLKAAFVAGLPCPKPRDVLDAWKQNPPPDVQVMPDGVKYNDGLGNPKEADLKAMQQAIKGLLAL